MPELLVFADSNVFIYALRGGILNPAKLALHLSRENKINLVTSGYVLEEVREALIRVAEERGLRSDYFVSDFDDLIKLSRLEIVANPDKTEIDRYRGTIKHAADVPVLAAAKKCDADIILTDNLKHFTKEVEKEANILVVRPSDFPNFIHIHTAILSK